MFTTGKLFEETYSHLRFADKIIKDFGSTSAAVIAAATGQAPYRGTNQFLEGFIRWQAAGNPADWEAYLYQIFGERHISRESLRTALEDLGLETVLLQDWPGFSDFDYESIEQYTQDIVHRLEQQAHLHGFGPGRIDSEDDDFSLEALRKAKPEAEALVIIQEERDGNYYILSEQGEKSPSWFISNTSMLNILVEGKNYVQFMVPGLVMMHLIESSYTNASSSLFISRWHNLIQELWNQVIPIGELPCHAALHVMVGGLAD